MRPLPASGSVWGQPVVVRHDRTNRYDNDVSTADTIVILRQLAHQWSGHPLVVRAVLEAASNLPDDACQRDIAHAIFYWTRGRVAFVQDERLLHEHLGVAPENLDKELLIPPPVLLQMPVPMGDCDDFSLLVASMALTAGLRPFYVTVAADAGDPRKWSHIYVCVRLQDEGGQCFPLDAGNRLVNIPPGWESGRVTRKAIWPI